MTGIATRQLTEADWAQWRALCLAALATDPDAFGSTLAEWSGPGDAESRWRGRLAAVPCNLVAEQGGVGVGMVSVTAPVDGVSEVLSMWVAPAARGSGVGDALMLAALRWARDHGAARVALDVRHRNRAAVALYRRHGFSGAGWATGPGDVHPERRMVLVVDAPARPAGEDRFPA